MAGTARKSTGGRRKVTKAVRQRVTASRKKIEDVDPNKDYVVEKMGPIYIGWGKRRKKNKKGKIVKEYYIKDTKKHHIWVKWRDAFADDKAQGKFDDCNWSAEPQDSFQGDSAKEEIKNVLKQKTIWPWPGKDDDSYEDRRSALLSAGYKEWVPVGGKKNKQKWEVQDPIEPQTGSSDDGSENEESTSTGTDEPEDEEENDEV